MKRPPVSLTIAATIAVALITSLASWYIAKWQSEKQSTILLTFAKEQFDARLAEYPKLWRTLSAISTRAETLTPEKAHTIAEELRGWEYDKGGLVADSATRSLVYQLREACFDWKSGEQPPAIYDLKTAVMYSCRNDLSLVSDEGTKPSNGRVNERNRRIQELQKKAGLVYLP
jgi:hypothetical protein